MRTTTPGSTILTEVSWASWDRTRLIGGYGGGPGGDGGGHSIDSEVGRVWQLCRKRDEPGAANLDAPYSGTQVAVW